MFAYHYQGGDAKEPDHRLCAPCWNGPEKLTVVLHKLQPPPSSTNKPKLCCPLCKWEAVFR